MATFQQIRDKANTRLATLWSVITSKQDAYFVKHGTYFGFNWTPSAPPLDGEDTAFTINRPSRFHVAADVDFTGETAVPFAIQVIRHDGTTQGYTAFVRINHEGTIYQRSRTNTGDDSGWSVLTPSIYG
jgi:hypothetical protein